MTQPTPTAPITSGEALKIARDALMTCEAGGYRDVDGDWVRTYSYDQPKVAAALHALHNVTEQVCPTDVQVPSLPDSGLMFLNRGEQPEDTADLECPACSGSGHIDDFKAWEACQAATESADGLEAKRLDALRDESWDLRCMNLPTGGDDFDIGWQVIEHHMTEPHERVVAEVFNDDPRAAIDAAILAQQGATT